MRNLFSLITIFSLLGLALCQTYIDTHVCNGFDNSSPIQATVTTATGTWAKNISFAQCADFNGVTTTTGSMSATFDLVLFTPTGPSSTFRITGQQATLVSNSGQNVFVVWANAGATQLVLTQIFTTADNRASGNQALYVGGDFTYDLNQVNITVPGFGTIGTFDSGHYSSTGTAIVGPAITDQDPAVTVVGYYTNPSSNTQIQKILSFPVGNVGPRVLINTWPASTFYALLCGSIGADLSGSGYRIMGSGLNGFGVTFNNTGSAPIAPGNSTAPPTGPSQNPPPPNGNGSQGALDILSPLTFILATLFALIATQL